MKEAPTDLEKCLAILALRRAACTQDEVASIVQCAKLTVANVERWFSDTEALSYSEAVKLCHDAAIRRVIDIDLIPKEEVSKEFLEKVLQITGDDILRHYRGDYLKKKAEEATIARYKEGPHQQKMRDLAGNLINEISLPWIGYSFIAELKPGPLTLGREGFPVRVTKQGTIEVPIDIQADLRSHLLTGGFSKVPDDIELWKQGVAEYLIKCRKLLTFVRRKLERAYQVSIPTEYRGQPGFTLDFPITICADAVEQARSSPHYRCFPYKHEDLGLRFGAFLIYQGVQNGDLNRYEEHHKELRKGCAKWKQAKEIAKCTAKVNQHGADIVGQLQKFIDMERLRGSCDLCAD